MPNDVKQRRLAALLMAGVLVALAAVTQADPQWRENGNSKAAEMARSGGQCVRETNWMRRNHMALVKHDRDLTVKQGIRNIDGSLAGCVSCHANRDPQGSFIAVNRDDQFCDGCHEFTGVTLDCFQCHSTVPGR